MWREIGFAPILQTQVPFMKSAAWVLINEKILVNYKIRNTGFQDESS